MQPDHEADHQPDHDREQKRDRELVERDPERAGHAARADHAAQPHDHGRGRRKEQRIDQPARRDLPDGQQH